MANKKNKAVSEEQMLKALGELEEHEEGSTTTRKGNVPDQMKNLKAANGGLSDEGAGEGEEGDVNPGEAKDGTQPMAKASDEGDESSEDSDESESESPPVKKNMKKSTREAMEGNETIRKGVEVSPFLEALADVMADSLDQLSKSVAQGGENQADFNDKLRKAVVMQGRMLIDISQKLDDLGNAPATTRKSVLSKSEIVERQLGGKPQETDFTKSEVLDALVELASKQVIPPEVVSSYESTDWMDPNSAKLVEEHLRKSHAA